jgi:hypothetical protein
VAHGVSRISATDGQRVVAHPGYFPVSWVPCGDAVRLGKSGLAASVRIASCRRRDLLVSKLSYSGGGPVCLSQRVISSDDPWVACPAVAEGVDRQA